jgi:phage/plasmid-associated DNA primase
MPVNVRLDRADGDLAGFAVFEALKLAGIHQFVAARETDAKHRARLHRPHNDRKYLSPWTGQLQVRFVILSNELPQFDERSGALAGRFIVLSLTRSFFGREDLELTKKLLAELPGILNWAIAGWTRLSRRGYFILPASGDELAKELEELSSPILAFVNERCELEPGQSVECKRLYNEWCEWNIRQGRSISQPINLFGRALRAAVPGLKVTQPRRDGKQNKKVACISDARISRRADLDKIAERLLSITGEDTIAIDQGSAERHQPCRIGGSNRARWSIPPTRSPTVEGLGSGAAA